MWERLRRGYEWLSLADQREMAKTNYRFIPQLEKPVVPVLHTTNKPKPAKRTMRSVNRNR